MLVAAWLVPGVSVSPLGFIAAVVIFTVAQAILSPFFLKMASRYASAFLGGIGLVSTLAALILASLLTNGLSIRGIGSWIAATVVVWLVTALATLVLPALVLREKKAPPERSGVLDDRGFDRGGHSGLRFDAFAVRGGGDHEQRAAVGAANRACDRVPARCVYGALDLAALDHERSRPDSPKRVRRVDGDAVGVVGQVRTRWLLSEPSEPDRRR